MRKLILIAAALSLATPAFAQKIKVRKVKGNQAVIEFSGAPLRTGSVYEISSESFGEVGNSGSRANLLGISFSLKSGKADNASSSSTVISVAGSYGWNSGSYEYGPLLSYSSSNANNGNTASTIQVGGFVDYNLIPNLPGEVFIYGLGGTASFGSNDSGSGSTTSLMGLTAGPFVKWFAINSTSAVRFDALYEYTKYSGNASDVAYSGILLRAGIATYF